MFPIDGISDSNLKATIMFYEVKLLDLICIVSKAQTSIIPIRLV